MKTEILDKLIPLADAHQKADEYISGTYWHDGKGCAVGCSIADMNSLGVSQIANHGNHAAIAAATEVPEMLWRMADNIFEGLPDEQRPGWTPRFLRAVRQSKDLDNVPARIMCRLALRLAADAIREDVRATCVVVAELWRRRSVGDEPKESEWNAAWEQADLARKQADLAWEQADLAREQADLAWEQADLAWEQADLAREQWWAWAADMVCEELTR